MTYNFDPDKWLDDEIFMLSDKLKKKRITQKEYDDMVESLEKKHDRMWQRLNGTYQVLPD